jgi:hypothetical protein
MGGPQPEVDARFGGIPVGRHQHANAMTIEEGHSAEIDGDGADQIATIGAVARSSGPRR